MIIKVPASFLPERQYILDVLLTEFLGVEFTLEISPEHAHYSLVLPNGNELVVQDHFFGRLEEQSGYLDKSNVPDKVLDFDCEFTKQPSCLMLYGENTFLEHKLDARKRSIEIGLDIFASSFFMLTRWEEYVSEIKDKHGRAEESLHASIKFGFHHRPIVNEYVEMLFSLLKRLGLEAEKPERQFKFFLTHDVDQTGRYDSFKKYVSAVGGDLLLRKNPLLVPKTTIEFLSVKSGLKKDNYDTFDYIMDLAEKHSLKSRFYFIPGVPGEYDFRYDVTSAKTKAIVQNIVERNHEVGIHGSYASYNDNEQFIAELERLEALGVSVKEGRQHYLRFENPTTWQMWEDAQLEVDSTMGFHSTIGFRSGVCYSYSLFNILSRKKLKLKERPLIVMEAPLVQNAKNSEQIMEGFNTLVTQVRRYEGEFVFLWHPNNLFHPIWRRYVPVFEKCLALV